MINNTVVLCVAQLQHTGTYPQEDGYSRRTLVTGLEVQRRDHSGKYVIYYRIDCVKHTLNNNVIFIIYSPFKL